jgi:hypothetical protein
MRMRRRPAVTCHVGSIPALRGRYRLRNVRCAAAVMTLTTEINGGTASFLSAY